MKEQEHIYFTYKRIAAFAFTYLALTTAYTVWQVSGGWFSGLSPTLTLMLRLAACIVMYYAIDAGLPDQIRFVVRVLGDSEQRRAAGAFFIALSILVVAIRFPTTTAVTYLAAGPMATAIYKAPDNSDKLQSIEKAQAVKAGDVAALKREYDQLKRSERARIAQSEKSGKSAINSAIASQGNRVEELYRSGNAWLMQDRKFKTYREGIRAAKAEAEKLVQAEKNKTEQARRAYLAALSGKDVVAEAIATDIKAQTEQYSRTVSGMTTAIYIIDFIAAFVAFILSIAVVAYERKNKVAYASPFADLATRLKDRYTKDVLDNAEGAGLALWSFFVAMPLQKTVTALRWLSWFVWVKLVGSLERLLQIDLDGNGDIGNKNPAPAAQPAQNPPTNSPTNSPRKIIPGFVWNNYGKRNKNPPTSTPTNRADIPNVGLTPTMPALSPTNPLQNLGANPPTNPPTLAEKVGKKLVKSRAQKGREVTNLAEAVRTAYKKGYNTFESLKAQAIKEGFTVVVENGKITVAKPLNIAAQAKEAFKTYLADNNNREKWDTWKEWERKLKAAGFTVVTSPGGRKVSIVKPRPQDRKKK